MTEDDDEGRFNEFIKPFKSLRYFFFFFLFAVKKYRDLKFESRDILFNFCFFEKEKRTLNKKKDSFQKLYDFVSTNKKFPNFEKEFAVESNWVQKCGKFYNLKNHWFNRDYSRNSRKIKDFNRRIHRKEEIENKAEIFEFLGKALQYQALNFVFPLKAHWFNDNSEAIFAYLDIVEEVHL